MSFSSFGSMIYCILHFHTLLSYTFLLSCTIPILHIHLYVLILSILYFVLLYTFCTFLVFIYLFHIKLYYTSYSCDSLYFHRIARLCFSYHIILYTFHIHFLFGFMSANTLEADSGNNWVYPKVLSLYETVISIC